MLPKTQHYSIQISSNDTSYSSHKKRPKTCCCGNVLYNGIRYVWICRDPYEGYNVGSSIARKREEIVSEYMTPSHDSPKIVKELANYLRESPSDVYIKTLLGIGFVGLIVVAIKYLGNAE